MARRLPEDKVVQRELLALGPHEAFNILLRTQIGTKESYGTLVGVPLPL